LALATLGWIAALLFLVVPVVAAQNHAFAADADIRAGRVNPAVARLQSAFAKVPGNADYGFRAARALIMRDAPPKEVRAMLDAATAADPTLIRAYLLRADYEMFRSDGERNVDAVRVSYEKALALNPADIDVRLRFATALERLGQPREAAVQLRTALEFNGKLPAEEPERLPPDRVTEIERRIAALSL